jgi:hypothetical protein
MSTLERLERAYERMMESPERLADWEDEITIDWPRIRDVLRAVEDYIDLCDLSTDVRPTIKAWSTLKETWHKLEEEGGE